MPCIRRRTGACGIENVAPVRLQPDHRVAFVADARKVPVVDPFSLQEFERGHRLGADEEEIDAARHLIVFL
jgi:hypothetical protein